MINQLKESLWNQFGASIDTLENAIALCPEGLFTENERIFYICFHTLVFLDYYLTIPAPQKFSSPLPFTFMDPGDIPENAIDDLVPDKFYSKMELLEYLQSSRDKCHRLIAGLTAEKIQTERFIEPFETDGMNYSILEILFYNMRHVQHHAAQLNLLLRQHTNNAPKWVFEAKDEL
jgi:DinB family